MRGDVGGEDPHVAPRQRQPRLPVGPEQGHRQRPGFLAAGTAGRPHPHFAALFQPAHQIGAHDIAEMVEMVRFAIEKGVVGGQRADRLLPLGLVFADALDIGGKGGAARIAHQRGQPRIDQHRLAFGQHDPRLAMRQGGDRAEILRAIDPGADPRQAGGKGGVDRHAASARRGSIAAGSARLCATKPSTSTISATRPSPRMVAPATPSTAR